MKLSKKFYTKAKSKDNFLKRFSTIFSFNVHKNIYTFLTPSLPIFDNSTFLLSEPNFISSFFNFYRSQSTSIIPLLIGK